MTDSMQPTFLTVDAQGRIGAQFTGTIFATGLSLLEEVSTATPNVITWKNSAGVVKERIQGWWQNLEKTHGLVLDVVGSALRTKLTLLAKDEVGGINVAGITFSVGSQGRTLFDEAELSNFVQNDFSVGFGANRKLGRGSSFVNVAAGQNLSENRTVFHELGAVPAAVVVTSSVAGSGPGIGVYNVFGQTSTSFLVNAWFPSAAGPFTDGFSWIAMS